MSSPTFLRSQIWGTSFLISIYLLLCVYGADIQSGYEVKLMPNNELTKISVFDGKNIRRIYIDKEWWFSVVDIIALLTESENPRDYWYKMKIREKNEAEIELSTFCRQLKLEASDGKKYQTDCANTEGVFRIIQSIPSSKAEPFKLWLAKIGRERIQEIENPELGIERVKNLYAKKGAVS